MISALGRPRQDREFGASLGYTTRPSQEDEVEEMIQSCLATQHEDLIQNPQNPHTKPGAAACACNPATGNGDRIAGAFWLSA